MNRRHFLSLLSLPALGAPQYAGLALNEDCNHFFVNRRKLRLTSELIRQWVDQYANTQVRELILNVNAMRSSFASKHREAWWTGFDPTGGPDQPFLAEMPSATSRQIFHDWIRCAWQMNEDGLDLYRIWIPEIRKQGMSPWVSVRMNDLHDVDNEKHPMHSSFWRDNKQYRRVPYREEQRDKALDYTHQAVRDYYFRYIEEVCERYDFDTLELDWMRHGYHFPPGHEDPRILLQYHREVRKLVDSWSRKRKHPIGVAVRVPSSPTTAYRMGMDAVAWAQEGLVDFVTATNYWRTTDNNMPMNEWRRLLPKRVKLAAGLELGMNAFFMSLGQGGRSWQSNSLETARGTAAAYLQQGVDRIYLFNYMDSDTTLDDGKTYPQVLRECGGLATIADKPRRHVVTYQDTFAPGEAIASALPAEIAAGRWRAFRLPTGPLETKLKARIVIASSAAQEELTVRLNGRVAVFAERVDALKPGPNGAVSVWNPPAGAVVAGDNVIEVASRSATRIEWVELAYA